MDPEQNDAIVRLTPEETEFTVRAYEISGKKVGIETPYTLDNDLLVIEEVAALAVRSFIIRTGVVSERLEYTFRKGLIVTAGARMPSNQSQQRTREAIQLMQNNVVSARNIAQQLTKYFDLPDDPFLEIPQ